MLPVSVSRIDSVGCCSLISSFSARLQNSSSEESRDDELEVLVDSGEGGLFWRNRSNASAVEKSSVKEGRRCVITDCSDIAIRIGLSGIELHRELCCPIPPRRH